MIHICIVNHGHDSLIVKNQTLVDIAKEYNVYIKSNTLASTDLIQFTKNNNITLFNKDYGLGFGENNNYVFKHLLANKLIEEKDHFLVINPDVTISYSEIKKLDGITTSIDSDIYTINLFNDKNFSFPEPSIKKFPSIFGPLLGLIHRNNRKDAYNKNEHKEPIPIEWAAGSFLMFTKKSYEALNGFDERFFMYFEDVDLCKRASRKNMTLMYVPQVKAIHIGAYKNRKLLSKHFWWYLESYLRYHFIKNLVR